MRTFHVGGVAQSSAKTPEIVSKNEGVVVYKDLRTVQDSEGNYVVLNKNGAVSIQDKSGLEIEAHNLVIGAVITVEDGGKVKKGAKFVSWDPYNVPILTAQAGKVEFRDMILNSSWSSHVCEGKPESRWWNHASENSS